MPNRQVLQMNCSDFSQAYGPFCCGDPMPGGEDARQARGAYWRSHARHTPPPPWEQGRNCIHVLWEVSVKRIYLRWHRRLSRSDLTKLWPGLLLGLSKFG